MQVIIPMSGLGSRFSAAGYDKLKPLIEVDGKPMIEWVASMFSKDDKFVFICRDEHLRDTNMRKVIEDLGLNHTIIPIPGHKKGPVYAVAQAYDHIDNNEPVMITYCDYYMKWDYKKYLADLVQHGSSIAGSIPCYTGFHPHLARKSNVYASCLYDENGHLVEIKEKHSWTDDKTLSSHSPGVYHFTTGAIMKQYFDAAMQQDLSLNGEYYVSLVYNALVKDGLKIWVPNNIQYFCQWGTPQDLQEFEFWTSHIKGFKHA